MKDCRGRWRVSDSESAAPSRLPWAAGVQAAAWPGYSLPVVLPGAPGLRVRVTKSGWLPVLLDPAAWPWLLQARAAAADEALWPLPCADSSSGGDTVNGSLAALGLGCCWQLVRAAEDYRPRT